MNRCAICTQTQGRLGALGGGFVCEACVLTRRANPAPEAVCLNCGEPADSGNALTGPGGAVCAGCRFLLEQMMRARHVPSTADVLPVLRANLRGLGALVQTYNASRSPDDAMARALAASADTCVLAVDAAEAVVRAEGSSAEAKDAAIAAAKQAVQSVLSLAYALGVDPVRRRH